LFAACQCLIHLRPLISLFACASLSLVPYSFRTLAP
jgi:hypothetical protein